MKKGKIEIGVYGTLLLLEAHITTINTLAGIEEKSQGNYLRERIEEGFRSKGGEEAASLTLASGRTGDAIQSFQEDVSRAP